MGDRPTKGTRELCTDLLRETQLFAGLSDEQLAVVILRCRQVHCREGRILLSEGDEIAEVLVVLQGEVKLFQDFRRRPKPVTVEKTGRWGVIGCCALRRSREHDRKLHKGH